MQTQNVETVISPRIDLLQQLLESGKTTALDEFWESVKAEGTPLIESLPDDEKHALVTFLWRAEEPVEHVVLYSELLRGMWWNNWSDALLFRLMDTNLYYRTYRVRTDMRFVYWIAPNLPLIHLKDVNDWDAFMAYCQVDPLNPNVYIQDKDRSFVEMPLTLRTKWHEVQPGTPQGRVEQFPWHSELLNNDRHAWVYTPPGYVTDDESYPLFLLFDGDVCTTELPVPTIFDNLIASKRTPPFVAIMLDSPDRNHELRCNETFANFIVTEIIPWMRKNYRITTNPNLTTVAGISAGGLMAGFMGLRYSEVFGNVLSNSGSFTWSPEQEEDNSWSWQVPSEGEWLIRQFVSHDKLPLRFHLDAGLLEDQRDFPNNTLLQANRHMRNVLVAKGYSVHYSEFCGGHQYINFRHTLTDGMIALMNHESGL